MSIATISYSSLKNSSKEAIAVAKKLDKYADNLENSICGKLVGYSGEYTANIQRAKQQTNNKIEKLRGKSLAYEKYAEDLKELKEKCVETDKSVKSMVSQLTASFKQVHGIKNSSVQNTINFYLSGVDESSCVNRWLNKLEDKWDSFKDSILQSIKTWWNYDGGKQLVSKIAISVVVIVAAVIAIILAAPELLAAIAAIAAGGALALKGVVAIATTVGGLITLINEGVNIGNELWAYEETNKNENPAYGKRKSKQDTLQDLLKQEFDSKFVHNIAMGIDMVSFVCAITSLLGGLNTDIKNLYKWGTGSAMSIESIKIKDILTKSSLSQIGSKIKNNIITEFGKFKGAFISKDFSIFGEYGQIIKTDFIENFKKTYTKFDTNKDKLETTSNYLNLLEKLLDDKFSLNTFALDTLKKNVCVSTLDKIVGFTSTNSCAGVNMSVSNITKNINSIKNVFSGKVNTKVVVDKKLYEKLSIKCSVDCSVPEINMPQIEIKIPDINIA